MNMLITYKKENDDSYTPSNWVMEKLLCGII